MKNNTLGLSSTVVKAILTIAANLQANYEELGAAGSQNVRNPYPMHKLVINVLPTAKSQAMTRSQIEQAIRSAGYRLTKYATGGLVSQVLRHLRNRGAIKFIGVGHGKRYWFAL